MREGGHPFDGVSKRLVPWPAHCFGLSVGFLAFGIQAVAAGLLPWQALLISLCNVTSAGQMAGVTLMAQGAL